MSEVPLYTLCTNGDRPKFGNNSLRETFHSPSYDRRLQPCDCQSSQGALAAIVRTLTSSTRWLTRPHRQGTEAGPKVPRRASATPFCTNGSCVRELQALVAPRSLQGVLVRGQAGLGIKNSLVAVTSQEFHPQDGTISPSPPKKSWILTSHAKCPEPTPRWFYCRVCDGAILGVSIHRSWLCAFPIWISP